MKHTLLSLVISISFGLLTYWGYVSAVTGLSPIALIILVLILLALLIFSIRLLTKSEHKMISAIGFVIFALLLPCELIFNTKMTVDKTQVREYIK